jgi:hypothetical protein
MSDVVVDEALRAASPVVDRGYKLVDHRVYEQHFGSGWVLFVRNHVRVRIVNDRGLWFIEIGSMAAPEEWFDARLVLKEIGSNPEMGTNYQSLARLCGLLAETAPKWELLFLPTTFATARASLRSREIASATERFDVTS